MSVSQASLFCRDDDDRILCCSEVSSTPAWQFRPEAQSFLGLMIPDGFPLVTVSFCHLVLYNQCSLCFPAQNVRLCQTVVSHFCSPTVAMVNAQRRPVRPTISKKKVLTMSSACTGWGSDLLAAELLGLRFKNKFGVEIDKKVKEVATALHHYEEFYESVFDKSFRDDTQATDFFFAGFPCQPYSSQGLHLGSRCSEGLVVAPIIQWISDKKPTTFLLENVKGIVQKPHKALFEEVLKILVGIKDAHGNQAYDVSWKVLNARLHGGLPQNRERVFVAGVRLDHKVSPMIWPGEIPMVRLESLVQGGIQREGSKHWPGNLPKAEGARKRALQMLDQIRTSGGNPLQETYVLNVDNASPAYCHCYSPCITKSRGGTSGHWLSWKQRKMTLTEMMKLSGVNPQRIPTDRFPEALLGKIIGNAVPVTLLARVMQALLNSAGLL